ncbi:MAG: hypothetical protein K2K45_10045 [Muribaculaceae bacterium]|nr:hypothetical protein [Muribaculaceae bacterium]
MKKSIITSIALLSGIIAGYAQFDSKDPARAINPLDASGSRMIKAPAKAGKDLPDLILNPQGKKTNYLESGNGYFYFMGIVPALDVFSDIPTNIVYSDDGKVYIYNIIPRFPTEAYVEGTLKDNKITVTFPQPVLIEKRDGNIYDYYVDRLERELVNENEGTYWPSAEREVVYSILEDGTIEMEKSGGEWAVGITNNQGLWQGYADWDCAYKPNLYETVTPPAGLVTEEMLMISNYSGFKIGVGFDGNDVYLRGVCQSCPDSWVKGTLDGNKVTFENGQYLGEVPGYNMMGFFFGAMAYPDSKYVWAYELSDKFVMEYDAETKTMKTGQTIIINDNDRYLHYMYAYRCPLIHPDKAEHSPVPQDIAPISYQPYGLSGNCIGFKFYLPNISIDNYIIPKDEIYWSLYINDELYTFEPYLFEGLKHDMVEVPFNCDVPDIENPGETVLHTIYIPIEDFDKIGYISLHRVPGEEDPYYSGLVEFNNPEHDGIEQLPGDNERSERIFDLNGLPVDKTIKGHIYIVDKGSKTIKRVF